MKKLLTMMLTIFATVALAACGGNGDAQDAVEAQQTPTPALEITVGPPQPAAEIPAYITIRSQQFSTALTEFNHHQISYLTNLTDEEIASFRYMLNLTHLNLDFGGDVPNLASLAVLAELPNLTQFSLSLWEMDIADVDFTPLDSLTNLTHFGLMSGFNEITDLSPLADLTNVTFLGLWHNQISDLTPLSGLTNLTELDLSWNQIADITPLVGLTNLTRLNLSRNHVHDIAPLADLANLTELLMTGNHVNDLTPLANLTNLESLWLSENWINCVAPLAGLTNLTFLTLDSNQISDIAPLEGLTNLRSIWLDHNPVTDWTPVWHVWAHHGNAPPLNRALTITPAHARLFADALASFGQPNVGSQTVSTQAILVDVDGGGTPGVMASKWSFSTEQGRPYFTQMLFYIYDSQLRSTGHPPLAVIFAVTSAGRLIVMDGADGQGISTRTYTLLGIDNGGIIPAKSISVTEFWRIDGYGIDIPGHLGDDENLYYLRKLNRDWSWDWEQDQPITHEEFHWFMAQYGLYDVIRDLWELPDDTPEILSRTAN